MRYLISILILLTFLSCGAKKATTSNNFIKETSFIESKDSIVKTITKPIQSTISLSVRSNDSVVNKKVVEALNGFNVKSRSGNNESRLVFNPETISFEVTTESDGSEDVYESTITNNQSNSIKEESKSKIIKRSGLFPFWTWFLIGFVIGVIARSKLRLLLNPLKNII